MQRGIIEWGSYGVAYGNTTKNRGGFCNIRLYYIFKCSFQKGCGRCGVSVTELNFGKKKNWVFFIVYNIICTLKQSMKY